MTEYLALEWDTQQICGIAAQVSRGAVRCTQSFISRWPAHINPNEDPSQAGAWLKEELARHEITSPATLVALPREWVTVKPLLLPDVADEELADVVRLQAATKSALPLDQLLLDYLPIPIADNAPGRGVLSATLAKSVYERVELLAVAAGLELQSVGMSPAATAGVIFRSQAGRKRGAAGATLVISHHGSRVEISILNRRHLLYTHAASVHGNDLATGNRSLMVEVDRCLIAMHSEETFKSADIERVLVLGCESENPELIDLLRTRFSCEMITDVDPLADQSLSFGGLNVPENRWWYAPAIGLLLSRAGCAPESIDFLNPRKPAVKRNSTKKRAVIAAAGLILVVAAGFVRLRLQLAELDDRIEIRSEQIVELDNEISDGREELDSAKTISTWLKQDVDWIDQFEKLKAALDAAGDMYLADFHVMPSTRGSRPGLQGTVFAQNERDVRKLHRYIAQQNYDVNPYNIEPNGNDSEYPFQCELIVNLKRTSQSAKQGSAPSEQRGVSESESTDTQLEKKSENGPSGRNE